MQSSHVPKFIATAFYSTLLLTYVEKNVLEPTLPSLYVPSHILSIPRAYGLVLLVLIAFCLWVSLYGLFYVGSCRKYYLKLAKTVGENDARERYAYPNLYISGGSKFDKEFNCIQRSHQQIFETLVQFILSALVAALSFPLSTALMSALWVYARFLFTQGYATSEGDAKKRYTHPFARFIWFGLLANIVMSMMTCINVIAGHDIFWSF